MTTSANTNITGHKPALSALKQAGWLDNYCNAEAWYRHDGYNRHYHNWEHAQEVCGAAWLISEDLAPGERLASMIAALWHDAVYVPGAGENHNEVCSAAAFWNSLGGHLRVPDSLAANVRDLIKQTTVAHHLAEGDLSLTAKVLLDADLSGLALPYWVFHDRQINIIKENRGNPDDDAHRIQVGQFLNQFVVNRQYIYRTDKARELWETNARCNIATWLDKLS